MEIKKGTPIGVELVRRGIITEADVNAAVDYQRQHSHKKIGDIINILNLCDKQKLINAIGDILGEKAMLLKESDINIDFSDYISPDIAKQNKAIPFDISAGKIKVCFADTSNKRAIESVRLVLLNKGLVMDKYITFESNIDTILEARDGKMSDTINVNRDVTGLVDNIIRTGMERRASDIHIEPLEDEVRIRYRIDGELFPFASIPKEKQDQIIGRLKAISNMHQEKQEAQDGRIISYPEYNIRVSSQKNIFGEKFVLRLLKKNSDIKNLFDLGFPNDPELVKKCFKKKNSITIIAAPTGEGKTTTAYSIVDYLNSAEVNITTIEDPVEIRIPGLNQIEIDPKTTFSGSLRTVLRQDPNIILLGEVRDKETAEIAIESGQTGHYVLSTIHTIDSIEVITRLRRLGVASYDIASTLATSVSQRLIRKVCKNCAKERDFTEEEKKIIQDIGKQYDMEFDLKGKKTYDAVGCKLCNNVGYFDRIGIFEVLILDEEIREAIMNNASSIEIKRKAMKNGYKPLIIDGVNKVINGITTLEELNSKLLIY